MSSTPPESRTPTRSSAGPALRLLVGAALVGLLTLALLPSGSTTARWSSSAHVALPDLTMDTLSVTATPRGDRAQSSTTATSSALVSSSAAAADARWAPTRLDVSPRGPADPDTHHLLASALHVSYAVAAGGTGCPQASPAGTVTGPGDVNGTVWTTLAPGGQAVLCATVTSTVAAHTLVQEHGGTAVTLRTGLAVRSPLPATWTTPGVAWEHVYQVPYPTPTLSCSALNVGEVHVTWGFPGHEGHPPVSRWEVRDGSGRAVYSGTGTTLSLRQSGTYTLRAYPFTGRDEFYVEADKAVQATAIASVAGVCSLSDYPRSSVLPGDGATS